MFQIKQRVAVQAHKRAKSFAVLLPLIAAFIFIASAGAQTVVPITSEPSHHLVISNQYVRVFKVEVPPKAETLYHQHDYDYLYVAIGDADVTSTRHHEKPLAIKLKDGQVELAKGPFAHKALNNGDRPFRNVTVELLNGTGTPICGLAGGDRSCGGGGWGLGGSGNSRVDGGGYAFVLRSSLMSVTDFETHGATDIPANVISGQMFLMLAVTNLKLRVISQKGTQEISADPGDIFWNEEPAPKLQVLSSAARFVVTSFPAAKTQ